MNETKNCPFCGEEILAVAKKCKHCQEFLTDESDDGSKSQSDGESSRPSTMEEKKSIEAKPSNDESGESQDHSSIDPSITGTDKAKSEIALWNPWAVSFWSILLTPVFGAP